MTPIYYGTEEQIQQIETGFKSILNKFDLSDHYDNLLYVCLNQLDVIENTLIQIDNDFLYKKRAKEFAQLLLFIEKTETRHYHSISFKSNTQTVKVADKELATWLGETIKTAFRPGNFPFSFLGLEDMRMRSTEELKNLAGSNIRKPSGKPTRRQLTTFCMLLKAYLEGESELTNVNALFTDLELNFYFELLVLFGLLNPEEIDSEPKDYVSTMLRNNHQMSDI